MRDTSLGVWFKEETDELLEGFKISPEDIVLDVGCGDSPFLLFAPAGALMSFSLTLTIRRSPPWHPTLENLANTSNLWLKSNQGPRIKKILDDFMSKGQDIIARKPLV